MNNIGVILVVGETSESMELLTEHLTAEGYQVRLADSGKVALTFAAARPPELILLDNHLPDMDGFEVCRRLKTREESRTIPIIFINASPDVDTQVAGLRLGAVDFITLPFHPEEFLARIQIHLELGRLHARLEQEAAHLRMANAQLQREIAEHKRVAAEIRKISLRDELTGLYNRRGFITLAEQQLRAAKRAKSQIMSVFIDVDDLKGINDTLGHKEGDKVLIDTATILRATFRESDILARIGGDEFAVLTSDVTELSKEVFSLRLQQGIDDWNGREFRQYQLALSWGAATYVPESSLSLDQLISAADELMYAQKKTKLIGRI